MPSRPDNQVLSPAAVPSPDEGRPPASDPGVPTTRPLTVRLIAAGLLCACTGVLGLAAWLSPSARGFGTHQQLGLGPCGMILMTGLPCPTCGMTTAFAYAVRGRPLDAFLAQPTGLLLALATMAGAGAAFWTLLTGRWPLGSYVLMLSPYRLAVLLLVLLFGGWGLKVLIGYLDGTLPIRSVFA